MTTSWPPANRFAVTDGASLRVVKCAYPTVSPYLLYENAGAATDWLCRAFGFRERLRYADDRGVVNHAESDVSSDGLIMVGHPGRAYRSPDRLGQNTATVHVYGDDVDAHFRHAQASGARITREPADEAYGDRRYDCKDPRATTGHSPRFFRMSRQRNGAPDRPEPCLPGSGSLHSLGDSLIDAH